MNTSYYNIKRSARITGFSTLIILNGLLLQQCKKKLTAKDTKINKFERLVKNNAKIANSRINQTYSGLTLLVFFKAPGCGVCVANEIRDLNRFYARFGKHTRVFLVGKDKSYLKRRGGKFKVNYLGQNTDINILAVKLNFYHPVAILVDSNGTVQAINQVQFNPAKENRFYQHVASLFSTH